MNTLTIPTYIVNLAKRTDRKEHILKQFANKPEFDIQIVKAIENENGALGLWQTIIHIIQNLTPADGKYVLICEDDHQFGKNYDKQKLAKAITESQELGADVLMGGVSWLMDGLQIKPNLFWIDKFNGTQFIIVFKKFYDKMISHNFKQGDTADKIIFRLTENKFLIYPFISTQKEFGYSDVTSFNNKAGYVSQIFETSDTILSHIVKANNFYHKRK